MALQQYSDRYYSYLKRNYFSLLNSRNFEVNFLLKSIGNSSYDNSKLDKIDKQILGALTFFQANLCHWIFKDFTPSSPLATKIYNEIFKITIQNYCSEVSLFIFDYNRYPVSYRKSYDRLVKICKNLTNYYRELIKMVLQVYGSSGDIYRILLPLGLNGMKLSEDIPFKTADSSRIPSIRKFLSQSLCYLGKLSHYRGKYDYNVKSLNGRSGINGAINSDKTKRDPYKHSWIYYRTAINIGGHSYYPYKLLCENYEEDNSKALFSILYWRSRAMLGGIGARGTQLNDSFFNTVSKFSEFEPKMESMDDSEWIDRSESDLRSRELNHYIRYIKRISVFINQRDKGGDNGGEDKIDDLKKQLDFWILYGTLTEKSLLRLSQLQISFQVICEYLQKVDYETQDSLFQSQSQEVLTPLLLIPARLTSPPSQSQSPMSSPIQTQPLPPLPPLLQLNIYFLNSMIKYIIKFYEKNWNVIKNYISSLRIFINWILRWLDGSLSLHPDILECIRNFAILLNIIHNNPGFNFDYKRSESIKDLNQLGNLLVEEKQCINFHPIGKKGEDDLILLSTPSNLNRPKEAADYEYECYNYRLQCLLYLGYEMTKRRFIAIDDLGFSEV